MVKAKDEIEFTRDFAYSSLIMSPKVLRQVTKVGKGTRALVTHSHKHGEKTFFTIYIMKPKAVEILNISRAGKASKTKKYDTLFADVAKEDLEKMAKKI